MAVVYYSPCSVARKKIWQKRKKDLDNQLDSSAMLVELLVIFLSLTKTTNNSKNSLTTQVPSHSASTAVFVANTLHTNNLKNSSS